MGSEGAGAKSVATIFAPGPSLHITQNGPKTPHKMEFMWNFGGHLKNQQFFKIIPTTFARGGVKIVATIFARGGVKM